MTKRATIQSLNAKISALSNSVSDQMGTLRDGLCRALGVSHDGKRNIYQVYGYPETLSGQPGFSMMYNHSRREGISNRITAGMAKSCWRDGFEVFSSADEDAKEILIDEVNALKKAKFMRKIEAADTLNRIGRMAALFVGVPDGRDPKEEIGKVSRGGDFIDQLYFVPYAYDGIMVTEQEQDPTSPRYGLPKYYTLQRVGRGDNEKDTMTKSIIAHYSRVIHLNENELDSDIEGMGSLEPVFNRILDIDKATGGASEAYFRNAKGKLAYEINPDFANSALTNVEVKKSFQDAAEKYTNDFQDHTMAAGATVKSLPTPHYSPLDTVKVALWAISGYTGIPIRILTGEGSGQLAGSEDQLALNQIIRDRQRLICSQWIDRLFEILGAAGMMDLPEDYEVRFPVQEASTESQKAETGVKKADALQKVMSSVSGIGGEAIDLPSALASCGLEDIEVDEVSLDDIDRDIDKDLDGEEGEVEVDLNAE